MKTFNIPDFYKSSIIARIKEIRKTQDPKKKDFSPTMLDFGAVRFYIARHFGFCYGVENAIEISYKAIEENPNKKIYLLSQMIHNPSVNADLQSKGINFIMDTEGKQLIDWNEINKENIVIIPAFGTTLETEKILKDKGIEIQKYNTTCPFVERVWKKSEKLGTENYTIIIHGKANHEETRATFSHSKSSAASVIIKDLEDAKKLGQIIKGEIPAASFYEIFKNRYSENFDVSKDLQRIGVVNQTTMLATDTQEIADYLKQVMQSQFPPHRGGQVGLGAAFADTRDTLCYATNDNQDATYSLLEQDADFAIVVGGYNSSNTSHLVELLERKFPTYFISSEKEIISKNKIQHFNYHSQKLLTTENYLSINHQPSTINHPTTIVLTSGASCPDVEVDKVLNKLLSFFEDTKSVEEVINNLKNYPND